MKRELVQREEKCATVPAMPELLQRAGYRLRSNTRADCIHCSGHSVATVAFTNEPAYCHRCAWKSNSTTLAKELGLFADDPQSRTQRRREAREIVKFRATIERFELWRNERIRHYSQKLRQLGRSAAIALDVLAVHPECADAWDALARFCHQEGELNRMLDFLTCAKASPWLEEDSEIFDVFRLWRDLDAQR